MWVTEDKVEKYLAAGHKLAASLDKPTKEEKADVEPEVTEPAEEKVAEEKPKKKATKKRK